MTQKTYSTRARCQLWFSLTYTVCFRDPKKSQIWATLSTNWHTKDRRSTSWLPSFNCQSSARSQPNFWASSQRSSWMRANSSWTSQRWLSYTRRECQSDRHTFSEEPASSGSQSRHLGSSASSLSHSSSRTVCSSADLTVFASKTLTTCPSHSLVTSNTSLGTACPRSRQSQTSLSYRCQHSASWTSTEGT